MTGDYPANASLDVRALPVGVALASYLPRIQNLRGETEIHASLNGPLKDPKRLVAHLEVPKLDIAYNSVQLGLASPLRVDYSRRRREVRAHGIEGHENRSHPARDHSSEQRGSTKRVRNRHC